MYSVSTALASAINVAGRKCSTQIKINNSVIDCEVRNMTCKSGCSSSAFSIGSVISKCIESEIETSETFQDVIFDIEVGFYTSNNEYEYLQLGTFKTYECYKTNSTLTVNAFDKISYVYGEEFASTLSYPNTIQNVINEVTGEDTVIYRSISSALLQKNITISSSYKKRELLSQLAICLGAFVYADNVGNIVFATFDSGTEIALTTDDYFSDDFKTASESIGIVNIYVDDSTSFTAGSGKGVYANSEVMTQEIFDTMSTLLLNKTYNSGTVKKLGDPRIEPCDFICVTDANNTTYKFYCMSIKHTYNGGFTTYIESYTVQEQTETELESVKKAVKKAFSAANNKVSCYYQDTAPTGTGFIENDIWFDSDAGNKMYLWNGSVWVEQKYGSEAIAAASITTDHLVTGAVTAAKIAAHTITSNEINTDNLFAQDINFTGTFTGGSEDGTGLMKSYNYYFSNAEGLTGFRLNLVTGTLHGGIINAGKDFLIWDDITRLFMYTIGISDKVLLLGMPGNDINHEATNIQALKPLTARKSLQSGYVDILTAAGAVTSKVVAFSEQMCYVPNVVVTAGSGSPFTAVKEVSVSNVSSTGFTINIYRDTAVTTRVYWFAHADVEINI